MLLTRYPSARSRFHLVSLATPCYCSAILSVVANTLPLYSASSLIDLGTHIWLSQNKYCPLLALRPGKYDIHSDPDFFQFIIVLILRSLTTIGSLKISFSFVCTHLLFTSQRPVVLQYLIFMAKCLLHQINPLSFRSRLLQIYFMDTLFSSYISIRAEAPNTSIITYVCIFSINLYAPLKLALSKHGEENRKKRRNHEYCHRIEANV